MPGRRRLLPFSPAQWLLIGGASLLVCAGCVNRLPQEGHDGAPLSTLSTAYINATNALNRAPQSAEELAPYLPPGQDVQKLLTSPADGQPYVILWGTDPRTGMDLKPLVIGYEKEGKDGTRFVFTAMGVMLMSNSDFAEANFPPGHKPS